jgi:hypothetical protein
MADSYLAVLKAAYDYAPQSEDEIAIKENQLLFLLDKSDDECVHGSWGLFDSDSYSIMHSVSWWKIRVKTESQDDEGPSGLVPSAYVEPVRT